MKRTAAFFGTLAVLAALATALSADVKTREKTTFKLEGFLGRMVGMFGPKDGITSTVAVKGNRMSRMSDTTGQIIDLTEQKVYDVDIKKKEYKVTTFAQLKQQFLDAKAKAEKDMKNRPPEEKSQVEESGKQLEFEAEVKETGQKKTIAGFETREVHLIITAHEKGKKLEESGGFIMTNAMWLAPRVAALDEIAAFQMKYFQAVYGDVIGMDPAQMANVMAMFPSFQKMAEQMAAEGKKMSGTALFTTVTFESMRSEEEMKAATSQKQESSGGGGFGSRLGGMLAKKVGGGGEQKQRNLVMTTTVERLSVESSATAEDVAIPAGFKEKK
jgi:hypothetical protein